MRNLIAFFSSFLAFAPAALTQQAPSRPVSDQDIEQLESEVRTNPEDLRARSVLLALYGMRGNREARLQHVYWLIEHHPESPVTGSATLQPGTPMATQSDYQRGKDLWLLQMRTRAGDPPVLLNAARYFEQSDPALAFEHYAAARNLAPSDQQAAVGLARVMQRGLSGNVDAAFQEKVKAELAQSKDAQVLYYLGNGLKQAGTADALANEILAKAKSLNPEVDKQTPSMSSGNFAETPGVRRIRIGGNIQASKLKNFVKAEYPDLAMRARIQGTVRFNALIAADGSVLDVQVVSGHPLLVMPARTAVKQWTYETTLLNGVPVEVVAPVDVNFTLSQ